MSGDQMASIQSMLRGRSQSYEDLLHNESWNSRPSVSSPMIHPSYSSPSFAVAKEVEIDEVGLEDMRRQVISAILKKVRERAPLRERAIITLSFLF